MVRPGYRSRVTGRGFGVPQAGPSAHRTGSYRGKSKHCQLRNTILLFFFFFRKRSNKIVLNSFENVYVLNNFVDSNFLAYKRQRCPPATRSRSKRYRRHDPTEVSNQQQKTFRFDI